MQIHKNIDQLPIFQNAVLTVGSFDGVHLGHQAILRQLIHSAQEIKGQSIVITFHPHPRKLLSDKPILLLNTLSEKAANLASLGIDHLVVVPFSVAFAKMSPQEYVEDFLINLFQPKAIIVGYDHRFGAHAKGDIHFLRKQTADRDIEIIEIPANTINQINVSSTKIRQALQQANVEEAGTLLSRPYSIAGTVIHGNKIGNDIGFPTANIQVAEADKILPMDGVYAVRMHVQNQLVPGMMHIGNRPTISSSEQRIEVHLLDFDKDIYGQNISIEFVHFIRKNQKFDNLVSLKKQLQKDKEKTRQLLNTQPNKTAVVILNYNGIHHLKEYLPSVFQFTPNDIKIVVADNGSTDDSMAYLKMVQREKPRLQLISLPQNYGFAGGYNEALKQVDAEIYILLNSDVRVTKNWTGPLLKAMQDPDLSVCQPKILSDVEPTKFEYAGAAGGFIDYLGYPYCRGRIFGITEEDEGQYDDETEIFWATGAAMVIRSKLFWDFKGFDATFFAHNEEIDMCWQVKRAGYKIKAIPSSVVYHLGGGTLSYNTPNKVYLNFRNNLKMLVKNDKGINLVWKLPVRFILDGLAGILFLFQGHFALIWSIIRAHFAFYASIPQLITKRREIKQILRSLPNQPTKKPKGIFPHSIVWKYYAQGKRKYADLNQD